MSECQAVLSLENVARWCGARVTLPPRLRRVRILSVSNDSRTILPGGLFVALTTERNDGNRYAADALSRGAVAALVNARARQFVPEELHERLLVVRDPLTALQRLAARYRRELGLHVVAVTGSSGKTSTRLFIQEALSSRLRVGGTHGNLNNHIGVPITLLSLRGCEQVAVVEMGANHVGEIAPLSRIVRPDSAVVTNIGYAHVGLFGSLANTTRAKLEIVEGLERRDGVLYVNGDDVRLRTAARRTGRRLVLFGMGRNCDVRAENTRVSSHATRFSVEGHEYCLKTVGRHFVYTALPAIAIGRSFGLSHETMAAALARVLPAEMRGSVRTKRGIRFILDCYNANPSSMDAALAVLADTVAPERRIVVTGDMLELGRFTVALHRKLGRRIAAVGVRHAVAIGDQARTVAEVACAGGLPQSAMHVAATVEEAARILRRIARRGDTVLLKASRAMALERVYELF